ncbi:MULTISPECIES: cutinase family protein [unclassified Nocardia]|uniref:cutinase family protein n=1 Tax=unclassified Nocardia TaxID=2637762 RepID=UPI001CE3CA32|nr:MULTISPECIES: cutinase family protein [unclassified Nocardia]
MNTPRLRSGRATAAPRRHGRAPARLTACTTVAAVLAATTAAATIGIGTAAADPGCAPFTAVLVPGTTETGPAADPAQPVGLLRPIGDGLATRYGRDIDVRYLPYPAAAAPYAASESAGVQALSNMLGGLCPTTRVVLAGYSQGADITGDTATAIGHGTGPIPAARTLAVALISDPRRDPNTPQLGTTTPGQGVAGPRTMDFGALAGRVRTACAAGDLYCSTSPDTAPAWTALGRAFTGTNTPNEQNPTNAPQSTSTNSSGLDAATVVHQVVLVAGGLAEFAAGIPTLLDDLARLPGVVLAGDIPGAHRLCGEINTLFSPLVRMAARADLHLVARALELSAPLDTSGATAIAAEIVDILARADIARVAADIGTAQEIAWGSAEKLGLGDPLGAGIQLIGLVPVAADLAATAAAALIGTTSTSGASLASSLTGNPDTTRVLGDLARQGSDAARFYTSGVHQSGYDTTLSTMLGWLTTQIDQAR